MRTADLQGAILDWHTARAEGVPAADLELRANGTLCVRNIRGTPDKIVAVQVLDYSTNWALTGPLVEKHRIDLVGVVDPVSYQAEILCPPRTEGEVYYWTYMHGDTALIAICRAVVRAAFGDEVEDLPCA